MMKKVVMAILLGGICTHASGMHLSTLKKLWKAGCFEKISKNYQKELFGWDRKLVKKIKSYYQYFNGSPDIIQCGMSKKKLEKCLYSFNQNFTVGLYNKECNEQHLVLLDNNGAIIADFGEYPQARHVEINTEGTKILVSDAKFTWDFLRIHLFLGKKETLKEELRILEEYEKWLQGEKHGKH